MRAVMICIVLAVAIVGALAAPQNFDEAVKQGNWKFWKIFLWNMILCRFLIVNC